MKFKRTSRGCMRITRGFEEIDAVKLGSLEIEYGIIHGNNTIVFIKVGAMGSIYGYKNKYLTIAKSIRKRHGCSVIVASNPNGYQDDFDGEMKYLKSYADYRKWETHRIYYLGHSNGASLGMIHSYKYPEIKKMVCINSPLMTNPQLFIPGIQKFAGEKMYLVYGSKDPSFNYLETFAELESDKVEIVRVHGADHHFKGCLDLFIALPGFLFFGDEINAGDVQ